ncbi:hypothetical protein [Staphylothermus hellenicus]|uniref:Restriction endonuclease n=1 Tax=Staphylothermus hellenicus (strain DSM 12710 / JCM 10830 / BK20S6-10-b1 / P8) TaxID=591019 RepID=D7DAQ8_STAHD|nr:hypothetical protein [Staphylothermus hellenicus]ADI31255.1 hypothetical protein Shell_0108 [Staphylothermus hellenicus DSM 12710]
MNNPIKEWVELNKVIVNKKLYFKDIEDRLIDIIWRLDKLWRNELIEQGEYRQKGNYYRDTIISLIKACCLEEGFRIEIREARLEGRTDKVHKVDFAYIGRNNVPIIAGEVKAIGSPPHRIGGRTYPERNISIDTDKRIKEVKYTPIDLKRKYDPLVSKPWNQWIDETPPKFYTFWLLRLGSSNRLNHILEKIRGLKEYNNGVSAIIYTESRRGYRWVFMKDNIIRGVDELTQEIAQEIIRSIKSRPYII